MEYPILIDGFEERQISVRTPGFFSGARLLVDGQPAPKDARGKRYVLRSEDGSEVQARLHMLFLDPVPQVVVDEQTYKAVEPFRWYEWLWSGLPLLLMFADNLIGAAFGLLGFYLNAYVMRLNMRTSARYGLAAVITMVMAVACVLVVLQVDAIRAAR